jgi:hypothetical protein
MRKKNDLRFFDRNQAEDYLLSSRWIAMAMVAVSRGVEG